MELLNCPHYTPDVSREGVHLQTPLGSFLFDATNDGRPMITLGTEDGEALAERARRGEGLPPRLAPRLDNLGLVEYTVAGLRVPLPPLLQGEVCQVGFTVAWAPWEPDRLATWLAVDSPPHQLLAGSGCS